MGGFGGIREISGEDLQGFVKLWERICKDSQDFGRGFVRPWERICKDLRDFGGGFVRH